MFRRKERESRGPVQGEGKRGIAITEKAVHQFRSYCKGKKEGLHLQENGPGGIGKNLRKKGGKKKGSAIFLMPSQRARGKTLEHRHQLRGGDLFFFRERPGRGQVRKRMINHEADEGKTEGGVLAPKALGAGKKGRISSSLTS